MAQHYALYRNEGYYEKGAVRTDRWTSWYDIIYTVVQKHMDEIKKPGHSAIN